MPKQYEAMRDKFAQQNRQAGQAPAPAYKAAQGKAARIYNSQHPKNPVGRKSK